MVKKKAVIARDATTATDATMSRGLKVSEIEELYFITGRTDSGLDGNPRHPNDPVGQTRGVIDSLVAMLEQEGWSMNDVVRMDITYTKDLNRDKYGEAISEVLRETLKDVNPKPSVGTVRIVDALWKPGYFVEIEVLAAR